MLLDELQKKGERIYSNDKATLYIMEFPINSGA